MTSEAEISQHNVHSLLREVVVGDENIFGLDIPMHDIHSVVQVLKRAKKLLQDKRVDLLGKLIRVIYAEEIFKLAISCQLHDDEQFVIAFTKLKDSYDVLIVCHL